MSASDEPGRQDGYAEVVFDLSLDKVFDYAVPPGLRGQIQAGSRVRAPFRTYEKSGYVLKLKAQSDYPQVRELLGLESRERQIPPNLLRLAAWIADYYCCPLEHAVWALLPAVVRKGQLAHRQLIYVSLGPRAANLDADFEKLKPRQQEVVRTLHTVGSLPLRELLGVVEAGEQTINRLCDEGWLAREKRVVERTPFPDAAVPDKPRDLTPSQSGALDAIRQALDGGDKRPLVLHGVTGSGKTEVYLQAIAHCLELGREAIVLVPEISLTPQTCDRFRSRFGNQVSVLHSGLSDGERFDEWTRLNEGRTRIAIGARSALFAPFRKLGLIVVDEEHENSYKQDESPRYNARDVAVVRARMEDAVVVLGSATPSLETLYNCELGRYRRLAMPERVDGQPMPEIEFIDMATEQALGANGFFSQRLTALVRDRLAKGEQTILFLNRRGFASQLACTKCGYVAMCPDCSFAYTYHRKLGRLVCHLCGGQIPAPEECPQCHDKEIRYAGFGTERIESVARALFPNAMVARMDSDTMTTKDSYRKVLEAFRKGKIDILIGTQMIAKGLDFPEVTLVGLLQADIGLTQPDFRSSERTFQLVTQVAGRAGRGHTPGLVVVQTFSPNHYALLAARDHDCRRFYDEEMPARRALDFPPCSHMAMVVFRSTEEQLAARTAERFAEILRPLLAPNVQTIGPLPAPLAMIKAFYRYQFSLRGGNIRQNIRAIRHTLAQLPPNRKVEIAVDVDPRNLS